MYQFSKGIYFFLFVLSFYQSALMAEKESNFQRWVEVTTEKLDSAGEIVQTSLGPIQYVWAGNRERPVVVCIQGAFGGWDQSLLMGQNLLFEGFSVLAISRPGYLGSTFTFPGLMSNEAQAIAIVEVLDALKINKAGVMGFSAGAPVAFQIAKQFPNRVWALVLECIGAHTLDAPFYIFLATLLEYAQETGDTDTLDFETYMLYLTTNVDFYSTAQKILSMDNDLPPKQLSERITFVTNSKSQSKFLKNFIYSFMPLTPRLDGIENDVILAASDNWPFIPALYENVNVPTRVVQGVHDNNGNYEVAKFVNAHLPQSKLISIEGCGHFIWLGKNTKAWEAKLTAFLRNHAPGIKPCFTQSLQIENEDEL